MAACILLILSMLLFHCHCYFLYYIYVISTRKSETAFRKYVFLCHGQNSHQNAFGGRTPFGPSEGAKVLPRPLAVIY